MPNGVPHSQTFFSEYHEHAQSFFLGKLQGINADARA
jgi:hypothetical protein